MICPTLVLLAHVHSFHYATDLNFNDKTPGVGVECRGEHLSGAVGYYNNSFEDPSFYVMFGYDLVDSPKVWAGPVLGTANGYKGEHKLTGCLADGRCGSGTVVNKHDFIPMVGMRLSYTYHRIEIGAMMTPHLNDYNPGILHLYAGFHFGGS